MKNIVTDDSEGKCLAKLESSNIIIDLMKKGYQSCPDIFKKSSPENNAIIQLIKGTVDENDQLRNDLGGILKNVIKQFSLNIPLIHSVACNAFAKKAQYPQSSQRRINLMMFDLFMIDIITTDSEYMENYIEFLEERFKATVKNETKIQFEMKIVKKILLQMSDKLHGVGLSKIILKYASLETTGETIIYLKYHLLNEINAVDITIFFEDIKNIIHHQIAPLIISYNPETDYLTDLVYSCIIKFDASHLNDFWHVFLGASFLNNCAWTKFSPESALKIISLFLNESDRHPDGQILDLFKQSLQIYANFEKKSDIEYLCFVSKILKNDFILSNNNSTKYLVIRNKCKKLAKIFQNLDLLLAPLSRLAFGCILYNIEDLLIGKSCLNELIALSKGLTAIPLSSWFDVVFENILSLSLSQYKGAHIISIYLTKTYLHLFVESTLGSIISVIQSPLTCIDVGDSIPPPDSLKLKTSISKGDDIDLSTLNEEQLEELHNAFATSFSFLTTMKSKQLAMSNKNINFASQRMISILEIISKRSFLPLIQLKISLRILEISCDKYYSKNKNLSNRLQNISICFFKKYHTDSIIGSSDLKEIYGVFKDMSKKLHVVAFNKFWAKWCCMFLKIAHSSLKEILFDTYIIKMNRFIARLIEKCFTNKDEFLNITFYRQILSTYPAISQNNFLVKIFCRDFHKIRGPKNKIDAIMALWSILINIYPDSSSIVDDIQLLTEKATNDQLGSFVKLSVQIPKIIRSVVKKFPHLKQKI
ncbi:hypothetical protein MXB_2672 [Myxobolus squamalis]|nr:hypothetical protein MXB_2672 [Myxobolus squamalis]